MRFYRYEKKTDEEKKLFNAQKNEYRKKRKENLKTLNCNGNPIVDNDLICQRSTSSVSMGNGDVENHGFTNKTTRSEEEALLFNSLNSLKPSLVIKNVKNEEPSFDDDITPSEEEALVFSSLSSWEPDVVNNTELTDAYPLMPVLSPQISHNEIEQTVVMNDSGITDTYPRMTALSLQPSYPEDEQIVVVENVKNEEPDSDDEITDKRFKEST